jgi:dynein heavy chain
MGSLYEFLFNTDTFRWVEWSAQVPDYVPPVPFEFHRVIVPTSESEMYTFILRKLAGRENKILFLGESGTAKTTTISNYMEKIDEGEPPPHPHPSSLISSFLHPIHPIHPIHPHHHQGSFVRLNVNFSSRTSSTDIQANLEANIDKRTGRIYGPPAGKKLVVFIDDLNMPKVDTYGTQQPIALLLFLLDKGYMYDRQKDLEMRTIKDLLYIGAMGPPGGE